MATADLDEAEGDDIQALVDRLAAGYGQSVLVEDRAQHPVWWSTTGAVDGARLRTVDTTTTSTSPPVSPVTASCGVGRALTEHTLTAAYQTIDLTNLGYARVEHLRPYPELGVR